MMLWDMKRLLRSLKGIRPVEEDWLGLERRVNKIYRADWPG